MSEKVSVKRSQGRVTKLLKDKRSGWVRLDDGGKDAYFLDREVVGDAYDSLRRGDVITCIVREIEDGNLRFANQVEPQSEFQYCEGKIRTILFSRNSAFIAPNDNTEDLYFQDEDLIDCDFQDLRVGDSVVFVIGVKYQEGLRFANRVQRLDLCEKRAQVTTTHETGKVYDCQSLKSRVLSAFEGFARSTVIDPEEYEEFVFLILRIIGVHSLYQYDRRAQAGRADGFFTIGNLAVMYDCTLSGNFEDHKKDQIENYVNKLKQSQITFDLRSYDGSQRKKTLDISGKSKQVWIITRGKTREISDYGNIKVKEVSIWNLVSILRMRLYTDTLEEDELALNQLSRIENIETS